MANQLHQVLAFTNVAAAGQATLPHNINVNSVPLLPDRVFLDDVGGGDFSVIAVTTTEVTVQNNGIGVASVNVWLEHLHTIERAFNGVQVVNLTPQPFIVIGGSGGGGGGGGSGNLQAFRYTATGAEGSDFFVTLPAARPTDVYRIAAVCSGVSSIVDLDFPDLVAGDRTTTQFRMITTASLTLADQFDFLITDQIP